MYKTFELLEKGYAIGSTMHAETVEDVMAILNSDPLNVPPQWIARLTLVVNLYVSGTYGSSIRRFNTVHMLEPGVGNRESGAEGQSTSPITHHPSPSILPGVHPVLLSRWDRHTDTFEHTFERPEIAA